MNLLMKSAGELSTEFLGIVEYSKHFVIGWLEDPNANTDLAAVSLRYPLEFMHRPLEITKLEKPNEAPRTEVKMDVAFLIPEFGIEEERIVNTDEIRIIGASTLFGRKYISALDKFRNLKVSYPENYVPRPVPKPI